MQVKAISGYRDTHTRSAATPPTAAYQAYLDRQQRSSPSRLRIMDATKLRRAVIMARQGENWSEIGRAIGIKNGRVIKEWVEFLPMGLGL